MASDSQSATPRSATIDFRRLMALVWVTGLFMVFLVVSNGLVWPFQLLTLISALPSWATGPYIQQAWRSWIGDYILVAITLVMALGWGALVVNNLLPRKDLLGLLFATGVGLWIVAIAVLMVASVSVWLLQLLFAGVLVWVLPVPRWFVRMTGLSTEPMGGWAKLMMVIIMLLALLAALAALNPPFEYDTLEYHVGAPHEYVQAERIIALPHNFYSNMPQLTEMLYLFGLTVKSDTAAQLFHFAFGLLAVAAVYAVGTLMWSRHVGWMAAAFFYCLPYVHDLSRTGRVDLATTFYATIACGAMLAWWKQEQNTGDRYLWVSALAGGLAVATKWTAIPVVVVPLLVFLMAATVFRAGPSRLRSLMRGPVFLLLTVLPVSPWLVKNWLLMGNPVYPLATSIFPSPLWTAQQAALFASKHYPTFDPAGWWQIVERIWNYSFLEAGAVPLLLMVAPLFLLPRKLDPSVRHAGWLLLIVYLCWWAGTYRPWRFLMPACPLAAWLGAYSVERFSRAILGRIWLRVVLGAMMGLCVMSAATRLLVDAEDEERVPQQFSLAQYALGQMSQDEFVGIMGHGTFQPVLWMNTNLPDSARVLYLGEARTFYSRHEVLWSTAFDRHPLQDIMEDVSTLPALAARMRERKISHIYIHRSELSRLMKGYGHLEPINWAMFHAFLAHHATIMHETPRAVVYKLNI